MPRQSKKAKPKHEKRTKSLLQSHSSAELVWDIGMAKVDSELPPLRLVFKKEKEGKTHFIVDPIEVAMIHTEPWCGTWKAYSPDFDKVVVPMFPQTPSSKFGREAKEIAKGLDGSAKGMRNTISKFSNSTAIGSGPLFI